MTTKVETLWLCGLSRDAGLREARALLEDRSVPDLSRLMVIDDVTTLPERAGVFESLLTSRRMNRLLCLVIGLRDATGQPICVPGSIGPGRGSPVIWVSDQFGVNWPLSASGIPVFRGEGGPDGLHHLIEVLSAYEMFDQVCEVGERIPGGISSPGLRLAGTGTERPAFAAALARAIRQLTVSTSRQTDRPAAPYSPARAGSASLAAGGQLDQAREGVRAAVSTATAALARLSGAGGLFTTEGAVVREQVAAAADELGRLKNLVAGLFSDAHAPGGLTQREIRRVQAAGIVLAGPGPVAADPSGPSVPGASATAHADLGRVRSDQASGSPGTGGASGALVRPQAGTIAADVAESILAGATLPQVTERLVLTERALRPRGSRTYLPEVDDCCPGKLLNRFAEPPPLHPPHQWLPPLGALAAAFAGFAWPVAGVVIALAWAGIIGVAARRELAVPRARQAVAMNLAAGLIGAAIGAAIAIMMKRPGPVSAAALAVAVLVLVTATIQSWRMRVRTWQHELALEEATGAADRLTALVSTVAAREWAVSSALLSEVAQARIVLEGVAAQLDNQVSGNPADQGTDRRAARLGDDLLPVLRALVVTVLAASGSVGSDGQAAFERAKAKTTELIKAWAMHVQEHGPLSLPRFAADAIPAVGYTGDGDVDEIISAATGDPAGMMWQLCAPADVSALDVAARPQLVTFAPQVTRHAVAGALPAETVWTATGQRAGLLRLVPLRAGLARVSWSSPEPQEELR